MSRRSDDIEKEIVRLHERVVALERAAAIRPPMSAPFGYMPGYDAETDWGTHR